MKKILLLISLYFVTCSACVYSFLCCWVTENDQVEDTKEHLNKAKPITIDNVKKTELLCRYKTRKEDNITWRAEICSGQPACISLSAQPELVGINDPSNYLIWYEWKIESKKPGFAQIRLDLYKDGSLQRTQFVKVEVRD